MLKIILSRLDTIVVVVFEQCFLHESVDSEDGVARKEAEAEAGYRVSKVLSVSLPDARFDRRSYTGSRQGFGGFKI